MGTSLCRLGDFIPSRMKRQQPLWRGNITKSYLALKLLQSLEEAGLKGTYSRGTRRSRHRKGPKKTVPWVLSLLVTTNAVQIQIQID